MPERQPDPRLLLLKMQTLWRRACEHEGIADSPFVVFSEDNPHMREYGVAFDAFCQAKEAKGE